MGQLGLKIGAAFAALFGVLLGGLMILAGIFNRVWLPLTNDDTGEWSWINTTVLVFGLLLLAGCLTLARDLIRAAERWESAQEDAWRKRRLEQR